LPRVSVNDVRVVYDGVKGDWEWNRRLRCCLRACVDCQQRKDQKQQAEAKPH